MKFGKYVFKPLCSGGPESYSVFDKDGKQVGYVRLSWGYLYAQYIRKNPITVYETHIGDSLAHCFESEKQRRVHLTRIASRIERFLFEAKCPECGNIAQMTVDELDDLDTTGRVVLDCHHCDAWILVEDGHISGRGEGLFVRKP